MNGKKITVFTASMLPSERCNLSITVLKRALPINSVTRPVPLQAVKVKETVSASLRQRPNGGVDSGPEGIQTKKKKVYGKKTKAKANRTPLDTTT